MAKQNRRYDIPSDPWNNCTYQTGSTTPPKSHSGIIALLLALVIVLCGIITVLGITNVKLFQALDSQENQELPISIYTPLATASSHGTAMMRLEEPELRYPLGLNGQSVSQVYQLYYHLPQGLHVLELEPGCLCARSGIQPGDIITALNAHPITSPQDLEACLENYMPGDAITLTIFRANREFQIRITLEG